MGHVLYEAPATFQIDSVFIIPVSITVVSILFPIIFKRLPRNKDKKYNYLFIWIFCIFCFAFAATLTLTAFLGQFDLYNRTVGAYKQGNYEIVEGYVENFTPVYRPGHNFESFDINGVSFSYSEHNIQPGYSNTISHGGVITGNGQHLKIGYVYYNGSYGNIIVYIEELP